MFGLGINVNLKPASTDAVVVTSSPKNTGTEPADTANPLPTIVPAFLLANTTVYPVVELPAGAVVGVNDTSPLFWFTEIEGIPNSTFGILVVPFGKVTNLYLYTCVSSGDASNTGIALIAAS